MNTNVVIIASLCGPKAFLVEQTAGPGQLKTLLRLGGAGFSADHELAGRWNLPLVLCDPDWARYQKTRVPMTRPQGVRIAFVEEAA